MRVLDGRWQEWDAADAMGVAVGVFDGVHVGHQHVLSVLRDRSSELGIVPAVLTFDPHPLTLIAPAIAPAQLTTISQRIDRLGDAGVEVVAVLGFTDEVRAISASQFVSEILVGSLNARVVAAGEDFRFGADRVGHVGLLDAMGPQFGYETLTSPLIGADEPISSTRIRSSLADGDIATVTRLLGRAHELRATVEGHVVGGDVVTHELRVDARLAVPAPGAYSVRVARSSPAALEVDAPDRLRLLTPETVPDGVIDIEIVASLEGEDAASPATVLRTSGPQRD